MSEEITDANIQTNINMALNRYEGILKLIGNNTDLTIKARMETIIKDKPWYDSIFTDETQLLQEKQDIKTINDIIGNAITKYDKNEINQKNTIKELFEYLKQQKSVSENKSKNKAILGDVF